LPFVRKKEGQGRSFTLQEMGGHALKIQLNLKAVH